MSDSNEKGAQATTGISSRGKLVVIVALALAAFLLSYNMAAARGTGATGSDTAGLFSAAAGGGCCGGGGPAVEGATTVTDGVQTIAVDTSSGSFAPNVIRAKAGVPIVIDFSQASGGCLSGVYFPDFNINEDLTGGGKSIELPALQPGEYQFFCQMQMVSATIIVE